MSAITRSFRNIFLYAECGYILCRRDTDRYRTHLIHIVLGYFYLFFKYVHSKIGLGASKGVSTYFSANCDETDAGLASRFLLSIKKSPYNTRLFKHERETDGVKQTRYTVLVASAFRDNQSRPAVENYEFEGFTFSVQFGDHSHALAMVVHDLKMAKSNLSYE